MVLQRVGGMLGIAVLLLSLGVVSAQELPQTVEINKDCTIRLPYNWKAIPAAELKAYQDQINAATPGTAATAYVAGFQREPINQWMEHPYILIQENADGRVPASELQRMKSIESEIREGVGEVETSSSGLLKMQNMAEPVYDDKRHILWLQMDVEVQGLGLVRGISGMHLTEKGMIAVHCYGLEDQWRELEPVYEEVVRRFEVRKGLRYDPNSAQAWLSSSWFRIVMFAVGGAIVGAISMAFKK